MFKKFKALFGAQDMTVGSPIKCLLMFSVPLLIGNLAQLLYSTVDSVIVGKYVGDEALASIGVDTPLLLLFLVIFMAIGSGVMVMVSQYFGAKDYENLERTVGNSITLIAAASVVLTVGGILLTPWMLRVINTPPETYEMAKIYLIICFYGIAGDGFYNIMSGILRGMGESVFPLLVLILTTVLNIVLDLWFVIGLGMGIAGAAWATSIAKTVSAIVCLIKVLSAKNVCNVKARHLKLDRDILGTICRLGIPNGIAQGIMFLATIVIQSMINKMGFLVTASITAVLRVDGFAVSQPDLRHERRHLHGTECRRGPSGPGEKGCQTGLSHVSGHLPCYDYGHAHFRQVDDGPVYRHKRGHRHGLWLYPDHAAGIPADVYRAVLRRRDPGRGRLHGPHVDRTGHQYGDPDPGHAASGAFYKKRDLSRRQPQVQLYCHRNRHVYQRGDYPDLLSEGQMEGQGHRMRSTPAVAWQPVFPQFYEL